MDAGFASPRVKRAFGKVCRFFRRVTKDIYHNCKWIQRFSAMFSTGCALRVTVLIMALALIFKYIEPKPVNVNDSRMVDEKRLEPKPVNVNDSRMVDEKRLEPKPVNVNDSRMVDEKRLEPKPVNVYDSRMVDEKRLEPPPKGVSASLYFKEQCEIRQKELGVAKIDNWQKTILIFTAARTGSTLLMMLLNCGIAPGCVRHPQTGDFQGNPDVFIAGESENFLMKMWRLGEETATFRDSVKNPFYGTHRDNQIPVDQFFQRDNGCYRVLGAKEIQWFGHLQPDMIDVPQTEMAIKYLEFLSKRTWGLKVIFLVRNPEDLAKSAIWRDLKNGAEIAKQHVDFLHEVHALTVINRYYSKSIVQKCGGKKKCHSLDTFLLDFDSLRQGDVKELFSFLGEHYDRNRVLDLLSEKASFPTS